MRVHPQRLTLAALVVAGLCGAALPPGADDCLRGSFQGITATNEIGVVVGRPDPRDWGCLNGAGPQSLLGIPSPPPPTDICLQPAYPNPTTGSTRTVFSLPDAGRVSLVVWSRTTGHAPPQVRPVRTLVDADLVAGLHEVTWDGRDDQGASVPPGIYRAVFQIGGRSVCGDIEVQ